MKQYVENFKKGINQNYLLGEKIEIIQTLTTNELINSINNQIAYPEISNIIDEIKSHLELIDVDDLGNINPIFLEKLSPVLNQIFDHLLIVKNQQIVESQPLQQTKYGVIRFFTKDIEKDKELFYNNINKAIVSQQSLNFKKLKNSEFEKEMKLKTDEINALKNKLEFDYRKLNETNKKNSELTYQKINFESKAGINQRNSYLWLGASILSVISFFAFLICSANKSNFEILRTIYNFLLQHFQSIKLEETTIPDLLLIEYIKVIILKILWISVFLFIIRFCIKNYNTEKHNYTINSHKASSMNSLLTLLSDSSIGKESKDIITMQASNAIFSHQKTGYSGKENDISTPDIISGIKSVFERTKSANN